MVHFHPSRFPGQCFVIPFAVIGAMAASMVVPAPGRAETNPYDTCAAGLIQSGLSAEASALACAVALHPDRVSNCVVDIVTKAAVDPTEALAACSRDRRPTDLATCVNTIYGSLGVSSAADVLDNCRRSVLPVRYSDCVVGLATAAQIAPAESMTLCQVAGYRPENLAPTFIYAR